MENRYHIILTGKNLYKEAELTPDMKSVRLGTATECEIRLRKEQFFGQVELSFVRNEGTWTVLCSDNLYLNVGDARKLFTLRLAHGDTFHVHYQESNNELFSVEFLIDFENERKKFTRRIDIRGLSSFGIGAGAENQIILGSRFVKNDSLLLSQANNSLTLNIRNTTYGVYINGRRAKNGERIQNSDFFSISDAIFYYKDGFLWTENSESIKINRLSYTDESAGREYPRFKRNSRVKVVPSDEKIDILDPPAKPEKPKTNLIQRLLPSMGMLIASGVMAFIGSPSMLIFSGISGAMAIVTAVYGIKEGKKDYEEKKKDRLDKYNAYIANKRTEIEQARQAERTVLEEIYASTDVERQNLTNFSYNLFDRSRDDEDFLCVRLGTGDIAAKREINYKKQERLEIEDDLQLMPAQLSETYHNVQGAPVVCDLKAVNAVGVTGAIGCRLAILKTMVLDIVARQFHSDVQLMFVSDEANQAQGWRYRMLPHVYNETLHTRNIVCNAESKNLIFEYLYKELSTREQNKAHDQHIVVFFLNEFGFNSHPISKFVDKAKDLGVTFVFFGQTRAEIAQGCGCLIEVQDMHQGILVDTTDKNNAIRFVYNPIDDATMDSVVSLLAPVYTEEISLEGTLTKNISMFQLLNILAVDDLDLTKRWASTQVYKSMAAPIGVSKTGIVSLDLHDKFHGPHGLVAGTTGSGKSEILQTYILSMATLFHPYEVGFVIIDFKGGGMVNQFRDLPHLMGAITNIDGREINRSLKSIKAELQKRQRLFADADVNHIDKYIRKYKAGEVKEPLPHLIIIVDEFAELKAEQPEFMKELISAARIGRSLGVHLILATQKPAGQVNEQIWSNSRFKLCLKVQTQEDSNEVLKSPLAAEIKEPGRAYLQVGNNEIFELFQSAYSGASERADDGNVKEFTIYELPDTGKRLPVFAQRRPKTGENSSTQLDAIVRYVNNYCKQNALKKLPDICLPPLAQILKYSAVEITEKHTGYTVCIGQYDDPANQYQGNVLINLSEDNLMLIGSAQYGKTNVLQTIIRDLAERYTSKQVNIYILDFGSMILKNLEKLDHIGGVVVSSEEERVSNLFKLLMSEVARRKERLATEGVSSFTSYLEAGFSDLPQIVFMIDNLTAFQQLFPDENDALLTLSRDGCTVGVSIVVANSQTSGIGFKYLTNFAQRVALYCNDSGEYTTLFDRSRITPENLPGRSLVEIDHEIYEAQIFLAFEGEREIDRVTAMRLYVEAMNRKTGGAKAKPIPVVPEIVTSKTLLAIDGNCIDTPYQIPYGMNYSNMRIEKINLLQSGILALSGREESGKTNFVISLLGLINSNIFTHLTNAYILDDSRRKLSSTNDLGFVEGYTTDITTAKDWLSAFHSELLDRKQRVASDNRTIDEVLEDDPLLMLVVSGQENIGELLQDSKINDRILSFIKEFRKYKVFIILCGVENASIPYSAPGVLKYIKESKDIIFFDDIGNIRFIDVPVKLQREYSKEISVGDAYSCIGGKLVKARTVLAK